MIEYIFLFIACLVLAKSGEHDYKTKYVKFSTPMLIILCGICYMFLSGNNVFDTMGFVVTTAFLFAIPSFFSFGMGDFLIFLGLAFFIDTTNAYSLFLGIFLILWIIWTVWMFYKFKVSKKELWKIEYPLVPVIAVAFYVWVVASLIVL